MGKPPIYSRAPDDVPVNPTFDVDKLRTMMVRPKELGFTPRPSDVYVATYPRSGTTLTQSIVHQLLKHSDFPVGKTFRHTIPWIEALSAAKPSRPDQPNLADREAPGASFAGLEQTTHVRLFKTHGRPDALPGARTQTEAPVVPRVLVCVRNPFDMAVSHWHHLRDKPEFGRPQDYSFEQ